MKEFIISYIEDNEIDGHKKEIFEEEEKKREVYDGWYISTFQTEVLTILSMLQNS